MYSLLQEHRLRYAPKTPALLHQLSNAGFSPRKDASFQLSEALKKIFLKTNPAASYHVESRAGTPHLALTVGVFFSGGQAAGGHNVITGLFDGLKEIHPDCKLIGFLDGPGGFLEGKAKELTRSLIDNVRNQGGFDLIGSSRTKIETAEQFQTAGDVVKKYQLDALIVIGGDDSNTNAALLAEHFLQKGVHTSVIGTPKTIDGDLRSPDIEISFGFDSACKTYAEMIGNIGRDALSAKKYVHFIKLMGRSASHIALECALACHPNLTLIGEEKKSIREIIGEIADLIERRKKLGKEYGIILIPEGLVEFIPEMQALIAALNQLLAEKKTVEQLKEPHLSLLKTLPKKIQDQLLLERDPHGNVQVSLIETEQLIHALVQQELKQRSVKCNGVHHFFGYEGRSCLPSNFDANYCYSLGKLAALAARDKITGVILALKGLSGPVERWEPRAVPIVQLMHFEMRSGKEKPVIAKALVDLKSKGYLLYSKNKENWKGEDSYLQPGPIQFFGDSSLTDSVPLSL